MDSDRPPRAFSDALLLVYHHRLPKSIAAEFDVPIQDARRFVATLVGVGADIDKVSTCRLILRLLRLRPNLMSAFARGLAS